MKKKFFIIFFLLISTTNISFAEEIKKTNILSEKIENFVGDYNLLGKDVKIIIKNKKLSIIYKENKYSKENELIKIGYALFYLKDTGGYYILLEKNKENKFEKEITLFAPSGYPILKEDFFPEKEFLEDKNKTLSKIKANMHTLQTMIETYAVDFEENYPKNLTELYEYATKNNYPYWKEFINPFTANKGISQYGSLLDYKTYLEEKNKENLAGIVLYEPIVKDTIKKYKIYGIDFNGELLKDKNEEVFYLTNN
ncbi:MAG: hypothetical protein U0457_08985 [Candidatus Sericytochromatia bacterium]